MSNEDKGKKPETENAANAGTNAAESAARLDYNENLTEIVFILDRSGSMSGHEESTIAGFNSAIDEQRDAAGTALVSTVLFDDDRLVLHDRVDLREIRPMTSKEYYTCGCTALLDAIGHSIRHISNVHKYARKEDVPAKTLFFIITDGWENASSEFTRDDIRKLIKEHEEKHGWSFIYLAANIDAFAEAGSFGIRRERAIDFVNDAAGEMKAYRNIGNLCRAARLRCRRLSVDEIRDFDAFVANIDADFRQRSGRTTSRHAGMQPPQNAGTPQKNSRKPRKAKSAGTTGAGTPTPDANL